MRPSHARRKGRRYRYYLSTDLVTGSAATGASGWRIPAGEIEAAVSSRGGAAARAGLPQRSSPVQPVRSGRQRPASSAASRSWRTGWAQLASAVGLEALRLLIVRVELSRSELRATASFERLKETMDAQSVFPALFDFLVHGGRAAAAAAARTELRIVLQGVAAPAPKPDPLLARRLIEARTWVADYFDADQGLSLSAIARRAGANVGDVSRSLQLAFLAPDLVEAILEGTWSVALTTERLKRAGCHCSGTSNGQCRRRRPGDRSSASDREPIAKLEGA